MNKQLFELTITADATVTHREPAVEQQEREPEPSESDETPTPEETSK